MDNHPPRSKVVGSSSVPLNPLLSLTDRKLQEQPHPAGAPPKAPLRGHDHTPTLLHSTHESRLLEGHGYMRHQARRAIAPSSKATPGTIVTGTKDLARTRKPFGDISNFHGSEARSSSKVFLSKADEQVPVVQQGDALPNQGQSRSRLGTEPAKVQGRRTSMAVRAHPGTSARRSTSKTLDTPAIETCRTDSHPAAMPLSVLDTGKDTLQCEKPTLIPISDIPCDVQESNVAQCCVTNASAGVVECQPVDSLLPVDAPLADITAHSEPEEKTNELSELHQRAVRAEGLHEKATANLAQMKAEHTEEVALLKLRIDELLADREVQFSHHPPPINQSCQCDLLDSAKDSEAQCAALSSRLAELEARLKEEDFKAKELIKENEGLLARCQRLESLDTALKMKDAVIDSLQSKLNVALREAKGGPDKELLAANRQLLEDLEQMKTKNLRDELEKQRLLRKLQLDISSAKAEGIRIGGQDAEQLYKDRLHQHELSMQKEVRMRKAAEQEVVDLHAEVTKLKQARSQLEAQMDQQGQASARNQTALQEDNARWQQEAKVAEEQSKRFEARIRGLEEELKVINASATEEKCKWQTAITEKQSRTKEAQEAQRLVEKELAATLNDHHASQMKLKETEAQLKTMALQVAANERELRLSTSNAERAQARVALLEEHINAQQQQLDKVTVELVQAQQTLAQREQVGKALEMQLSDLEDQWGRIGVELQRKDQQLAQTMLDNNDTLSTLNDTRQALDGQSETLVQQVQQLQATCRQVQEIQEVNCTLQKEHQDLQAEKSKLSDELQSLKAQLAACEAEMTAFASRSSTELLAMEESYQQAQQRVGQLEATVTQLERELTTKQRMLEEAQQALQGDETSDLQLAKQAIRSLQEALAIAQEEVKRSQLPAGTHPVDPLQYVRRQDADALMLELSRKEEELMKKQLETLEMQGKLRHLQRELEGLHHARHTHVLEAQVKQLGEQLQGLKVELKAKEEEAELFTQELEDRVREQKEMMTELAAKGAQLQRVTVKVADLEALAQEFSRRATSDSNCMQGMRQELQHQQAEFVNMAKQASETQEALRCEVEQWRKRCAEVEEGLSRTVADLVDTQQRLSRYEAQMQQSSVLCHTTQTYQVAKKDSLFVAEQSYDFCSGLIAKCAASPIPRLPTDEFSDMDSTMDLGLPITPAPRMPLHLSISPTRVGWSPQHPSDEDVLLCNIPAVPFASPTPIRPSRKRPSEAISVTCSSEVYFTLSCTQEGSTHWARLTRTKRGVRAADLWKRSGQTALNRVPNMLCHPRMHKGLQPIQHRWTVLSQWFDQHRLARKQGIQLRRCLPSPVVSSQPMLEWVAPDGVCHGMTKEKGMHDQCKGTTTSPVDVDKSIDAQLEARAKEIPADLELVPSLLFPANARGPLESP